jgi:hypothetical protein
VAEQDRHNGPCEHRNWLAVMGGPPTCWDCGHILAVPKKPTGQLCGWCQGEGAERDVDGKLGADCPRCKGRGAL